MTTIRFVYDNHQINLSFADDTQLDNAFYLIDKADNLQKQYAIFDTKNGKSSIRMDYLYAFPIADLTDTHD